MKTAPSISQDTSRDWSQCVYCGATDEPLKGKDVRSNSNYVWQLSAACIDAKACSARAKARNAHMDERYSLTAAGQVAAAFLLQATQTRTVA